MSSNNLPLLKVQVMLEKNKFLLTVIFSLGTDMMVCTIKNSPKIKKIFYFQAAVSLLRILYLIS